MSNRGLAPRWPVACALALSLAPALTGCMVGPNYTEPKAPTADQWLGSDAPELQRGEKVTTRWWEVLNDPALNALVDTAYRQNRSLHAAGIRVLEAQAQRAVAFGLLFPQQQEAYGDLTWNQLSENSGRIQTEFNTTQKRVNFLKDPAGTVARRAFGQPGLDNVFHNWQFGFGASWELDLWGRYRRGIEAADAEILATIANYDDVLVSLISEVATNYVLLRALEEQLVVVNSNVGIQRRGFELADTKFQGGTTTALDSQQAASLLYDTEAQVADIEARISQTKSVLCVLLGLPPQDLSELLGESKTIPTAPSTVTLGIPADLLRRRPDVRRAERRLAAQSAVIGVATTDLLPSFSLNGQLGLSAEHFSGLGHGSSLDAFAGPSFRWNLLNYGRIENNIRAQDAAFQSLLCDYENIVLRAQGEVEQAIAGFIGSQKQIVSLQKSVDAATKAVDLAEQQYRGGIADYTRVLNTQDFLTTEQSRLVSTRGAVAANLIALYRALGGGWEIRESQDLVPAPIKDQMKERTIWGEMINADRVQ